MEGVFTGLTATPVQSQGGGLTGVDGPGAGADGAGALADGAGACMHAGL